MRLLFATGNAGKLREAREILGPSFDLLSPADAGISGEPEETGDTFRENALQKARWYQERCGLPCFADDSGLEVDALGGAPGIYSARYAGEGHDFAANIERLLRELGSSADRRARFRCVVALLLPGREPVFFDGRVEGRIGTRKAGCGGFGYDPVFIPDAYPDRTLAEVPEAEKNAISHRGEALRKMTAWLADNPVSL